MIHNWRFNGISTFCERRDLVIFPSYLLHEGPMNKSDKERVIVSFNIMGEPETKAYFSGANR